MSTSNNVNGFDDLFKSMDALAEEIGKGKTDKIWRNAMTYAFAPVLAAAKNSVPVLSGQLRDHIYLKVHRPQARDKSALSYRGETFMVRVTSVPRREDSVINTVINKRGKEQNFGKHKPVALAVEFGTAKVAPRPFLRPALETNLQEVQDRLGRAVWHELQWGKWAKKG
jgi:HK97 gp10 family phage protein